MKNKKAGLAAELIIIAVLCLFAAGGIFMNIKTLKGSDKNLIEESKLVLYDGPVTLRDATAEDLEQVTENQREMDLLHCVDTQIKVDGYDCYVYDTNVNLLRQWVSNYFPPQSRTPITYFDFEGVAEIEIKLLDCDIESVQVLPSSYAITPEVDTENSTIKFFITEPNAYTVVLNDSPKRAIHIFANALETYIPDKGDEDVIYIGPGEWDIGDITLEDNQTLYIAGGAVVHGTVNANFAENITVCGRGILDGSMYAGWQGREAHIPLKFDYCKNITLKDIILLNSNAWVCQAFSSRDGLIDGIKIISSRPNGDGITLQSCADYIVENCFVRTWDDSLVVKNYYGSTQNISFSNMQLWTDLAQSMEIGFETNKANRANITIENVVFEDITVLANFHKPVISIHNGDNAEISHIIFKDIIVENAQMGEGDGDEMPYLIDLLITQNSNWSTTKDRGHISDILIENVEVLSGRMCSSRIQGYDEEHVIRDVTIRNLVILGEKISTLEQGQIEVDEATTANIVME